MLVMVDNYDSFTYNLVQYLGELGEMPTVFRNDEVTVDHIASLNPDYIVISPGPGRPSGAGISKAVIETLGPDTPLLGVCLGHQAINEVYGGQTSHAPSLMHGKTSMVHHDNQTLYKGLPQPFQATRYHSLVADPTTLPECLVKTAWIDDVIMGVRHTSHPIEGVQFHPESILTIDGKQLLKNFLESYR